MLYNLNYKKAITSWALLIPAFGEGSLVDKKVDKNKRKSQKF